MNIRKLTDEQAEWLKENYAEKTNHECRKHLRIGYYTLVAIAEQMGLVKVAKVRKAEIRVKSNEPFKSDAPKSKKRLFFYDEGNVSYCMDCRHYKTGGTCIRTERESVVGALWQKNCFKGR